MKEPIELLEEVSDWKSYVAALEQCDDWWRRCRHSYWSVLGDQRSWKHTVKELNPVIRKDWGELDDYDRRRLLGQFSFEERQGWELLGRMRNSARGTVFGDENREKIQTIVHHVAEAKDDAFPELAFKSYETLWNIEEVGEGIATRLLTLARPDRFVSLNGASRDNLAKHFGLARTTLRQPENYCCLLKRIYNQKWYRAPQPGDPRERIIYEMRVALLDSFVYRHKQDSNSSRDQ